MTQLSSIPDALDALRAGRFVIITDDEGRENEGDLIVAAEHVTEEQMALLIRRTSGIVFLAMTNEMAQQLDLPPMVENNTSRFGTPFTVSIEAADGVTTGVSAKDRVHTVRTAVSAVARPTDLRRPGHVFPLRAQDGGVLVRAGHTEAAVDLCKLSGVRAAAAGAELMNDDGTMMRMPAILEFAKEHDIPVITIADLIAWRCRHETFIRREAESHLETKTGNWNVIAYRDSVHGSEHLALVKGKISALHPTLVRVHSECLTGDALGSLHCDCGEQLQLAMQQIADEGTGVLLYLLESENSLALLRLRT